MNIFHVQQVDFVGKHKSEVMEIDPMITSHADVQVVKSILWLAMHKLTRRKYMHSTIAHLAVRSV